MPIYMDLHVAQGLTAEDVARAHQLDLEVQHEVGCKCLTYWLDPALGSAYCLIEAPTIDKVEELHDRSHKQLPIEVIEVDKKIVRAFLGRLTDPEIIGYLLDENIPVFSDPAFRYIMMLQVSDVLEANPGVKDLEPVNISGERKKELADRIRSCNGRLGDIQENQWLISIKSPDQIRKMVRQVTEFMEKYGWKDHYKLVVSAGTPVDGSGTFFGQVIAYCKRMMVLSVPSKVYISNFVIRELESKGLVTEQENTWFTLSQADENRVQEMAGLVVSHYDDPDFNIESILERMPVSRSQLYRICKKVTGESPNSIIRKYRLSKSIQELLSGNLTVSEVSYKSGFNSPNYFIKCFKQFYGLTPGDYRELRAC